MTTIYRFAGTLEALETSTKREFLALLEDTEITGDMLDSPTFSRLIRFAHFYGMHAGEFASKLRVKLGTVSAWRMAALYPDRYTRFDALNFIRDRMRELNMAA
jgi:hypothetical protein